MAAEKKQKSWRRRISIGVGLVCVVLGAALIVMGSSLADLRTDQLKQGFADPERTQGQTLLETMLVAHGGLDAWRQHHTVRVDLTDTWPNPVMRVAMPWPENGQKLRLTAFLGQDIGRLDFVGGPEDGTAWGLQHWSTWTASAQGEAVFEPDDAVKFWVPTTSYFVEAPFRLMEGEHRVAMKEATVKDRVFDRVFITWGSENPDAQVDQYVAWIDRETKLLTYLEYTVRDMLPSITGCMHFRDYKTVQGIQMPMTMATVSGPGGEDVGHRFDIQAVSFGEPVDVSYLIPDPSRRSPKY